ncbi:MAG: lipid-A-disaccharide synthase [Bacteroidales bacterium]|nr:lipid-A-disaccharide synthase [Bacteroidales bacterium]MCB9013653.1 lipid-A-disaccharide synthase [Bacteroidales bacterium]
MRYYLIAGEASGDLHGSNLMKGILHSDPQAEFRFYGGDRMQSVGGTLVKHFREMAFMGFFDVLANIRTITRNLRLCREDIVEFKPDALILIDYAGFNLRVAGFAHKKGIKTFFYIAPKVWAWKKKRIEKLRKYVLKLFVIFPFEVEYFHKNGMEVEYYGNPLMDSMAEFHRNKKSDKNFRKENNLSEKPIVALLSGSRRHEISRCLPEMAEAAKDFPKYQFVVAGAPSIMKEDYEKILYGSDIAIVYNKTYDLLDHATAAVVTSGTATLETALFRVPQVVIFKTGSLTYRLGKLFVRIRFFSLVNLIVDRELVKEFLQFNLARDIRNELIQILKNNGRRQEIMNGYDEIIGLLGGEGTSERIAKRICELAVK